MKEVPELENVIAADMRGTDFCLLHQDKDILKRPEMIVFCRDGVDELAEIKKYFWGIFASIGFFFSAYVVVSILYFKFYLNILEII